MKGLLKGIVNIETDYTTKGDTTYNIFFEVEKAALNDAGFESINDFLEYTKGVDGNTPVAYNVHNNYGPAFDGNIKADWFRRDMHVRLTIMDELHDLCM